MTSNPTGSPFGTSRASVSWTDWGLNSKQYPAIMLSEKGNDLSQLKTKRDIINSSGFLVVRPFWL
jgi:hypothetical protein